MSRNDRVTGGRLERPESSEDERDETEVFEDETERLLGEDRGEAESEEGEELIGEDMERDYRPIPELDVYEEVGLDDADDLDELSQGERAVVEEELRKRDKAEGRAAGGLRRGVVPDFFADESSDTDTLRHQRHAERIATQDSMVDNVASQIYEAIENLEDTKGMTIAKWVQQAATRQEIKNRFMSFIRTFVNEEGKSVYEERIVSMAQQQFKSLTVDYEHLVAFEQILAYFLPEAPKEILEIFNEVAYEMTLARYPRYRQITDSIHVRICHLPLIEEIRCLRQIHMNQLIRTSGVVASCTNVLPQLSLIQYDCIKCRCIIGPFTRSDDNKEVRPSSCPDCQSNGPFEINAEKTVYKNYQRITIQESPGTVPAGRLPRSKDAILLDDMVDTCKPGDEIDSTGIYCLFFDRSLNNKQGFPIFSTHILVNNILKKDDQMILKGLTDDDIKVIQNLAKDERIAERIIRSIAPSIYGHEDIKRAIALALFGGVPKVKGQRLRGDINVLLCGDPGTAKSQFLKFIEQIAPRCIFTTGQGASAVGLTAYVTKNPTTREWTLEAGALVLADKGVCLIDEFDKMNDQDRTSIHEAMEQQSISISKAGIVSSLQARTTIIAAANPIGGRYDTSRNFNDNVDLSSPILSRFDILCVVRDVVDPVQDEMLSRFVVGSHMRHHGKLNMDEKNDIVDKLKETGAMTSSSDVEASDIEPIPLELLKKYIIYAKQKINPSLNNTNEHKLSSTYVALRRASQESGAVDVTVRYLESMIRLAEAHAKMHLREVVTDDDVNMAIRILLESFIATEKYSVMKQLESRFKTLLNYKKNDHELLLFLLKQLISDKKIIARASQSSSQPGAAVIEIKEQDLKQKAKRLNISSINTFINSGLLAKNHCYYDAGRKIIGHKY